MPPTSLNKQSFYGWNLVAALWAIEFLNMGFPFYGGGVINTYMLHVMPMSRSTFGLGFTVLNVCIGAPSMLIVACILRLGLRTTFVIGSALIFLGSLWMAYVATQPWQYLVGFGALIGTGVGFGTIVPLSTAITRWFRRYRGRAMAIAFSASGFAGFAGAPLLNAILTRHAGHFQVGWKIVAVISLFSGVVAWFFIRESPEAAGQTIDGLAPEAASATTRPSLTTMHVWTPAEAYRTVAFWMILFGAMACQFPFFFFNAHAILHMKSHGISAADAAWAMGCFTAAGIIGRFVGGWLLERIAARFVFIFGLLGYISGSLLELHISTAHFGIVYGAAMSYGFAFGCSWIALNTITGNFYGIAAFPRLNGWVMVSTAITCAPAGVVGGILFDRFHTYAPSFLLNATIALAGMIALFFARMPSRPPSSSLS